MKNIFTFCTIILNFNSIPLISSSILADWGPNTLEKRIPTSHQSSSPKDWSSPPIIPCSISIEAVHLTSPTPHSQSCKMETRSQNKTKKETHPALNHHPLIEFHFLNQLTEMVGVLVSKRFSSQMTSVPNTNVTDSINTFNLNKSYAHVLILTRE